MHLPKLRLHGKSRVDRLPRVSTWVGVAFSPAGEACTSVAISRGAIIESLVLRRAAVNRARCANALLPEPPRGRASYLQPDRERKIRRALFGRPPPHAKARFTAAFGEP